MKMTPPRSSCLARAHNAIAKPIFVLIAVLQFFLTQPSYVHADIVKPRIKKFSILSSSEITRELHKLQEQYPTLVTLTTSQREFDLPTAGEEKDCNFDQDTPGCYNYYITIEDSIAHPKGSMSYQSLPEVFLSGAVHGNERVGPTAVLETAKLLLHAASCESLPGLSPRLNDIDVNTNEGAEWLLQAEEGQACRQDLYERGISDYERQWLARLVTTRRIVIIPSANALGYDRNSRTEMGIDPNRDFPFDVLDKTQCMQTIAGRTINELFRQHMFQIALTFHGGTEVIGYEWGAPTYLDKASPDDFAQVEIGDGYSRFAGGFDGTVDYVSGTMNDLVYAVRGGMEDWAYAGSWDPDRVIQCEPKPQLHGPYSPEKTIYNDSTLRAFNMLIETSHSKIPSSHLGTTEDVLSYKPNSSSNGHIARNVRLSLMAIDIVEPYVSIKSLNGVFLSDDVVPMIDRHGLACQKTKTMIVPSGTEEAVVTWTVGGGFTVDSTNLLYAKWDDILVSSMDCTSHPMDGSHNSNSKFQTTPVMSGITRWHKSNDSGDIDKDDFKSFRATFDISHFKPGDKIAIFASARFDQGWIDQPDKLLEPKVPPMSHIVNARSNNEWLHQSAGKIIQGRKDWSSIPLTIQIAEDVDDVIELSNRFVIPDIAINEKHSTSSENNDRYEDSSSQPLVISALSVAVTFAMYLIVRRFVFPRKLGKKKVSSSFDEDDWDKEHLQLRELS